MWNSLVAFFRRADRRTVLLVALELLAVIAWLDYLTGVDVSLLTFYWVPVSLVTWFCGTGAGMIFATASVSAAIGTDMAGGHTYSSPLLLAWDIFTRMSSFLAFTWVLGRLRTAYAELSTHRERLEEEVAARTHELVCANRELTAARDAAEAANRELIAARDAAEAANRELTAARDAAEAANRELTAARDAAEAANRTRSAFLMTLTHELRTPLNAVLGFSELLQEGVAREDVGHWVPRIHTAGQHLLELIDDLLEVARLESTTVPPRREHVDVGTLVDEAVAAARPLADKNGNTLVRRVAGEVESIDADPARMQRSVFHLVNNACKFTRHGRVEVDVRHERGDESDWLAIAVADTGMGIPTEQVEKMFQAFVQADSTHARKYEGLGVGLALARHFCEAMGGALHVTTESTKGSTFTMRLPLPPTQGREPRGTTVPASRPGSLPGRLSPDPHRTEA